MPDRTGVAGDCPRFGVGGDTTTGALADIELGAGMSSFSRGGVVNLGRGGTPSSSGGGEANFGRGGTPSSGAGRVAADGMVGTGGGAGGTPVAL